MKSAKKILVFLAFAVLVFSASSCNRGYGCPTWSLEDGVVSAVGEVLKVLLSVIF